MFRRYSECFGRGAAVGHNCSISESSNISKSIIGNNVTIGRNVTLENAYIMSDVKICNDCIVSNSIVGPKSILRNGCKVTFGSVVGANVELNKESFIENSLVQSKRPEDDCKLSFDRFEMSVTYFVL